MKLLSRTATLILTLLLVSIMPAVAGSDEPLSADSKILTGRLPNGLSYYIIANGQDKGHADFYLAQKVGGICEEEDQAGMSATLLNLALRSTINFPDNTMRAWLESIGMDPGKDIVSGEGFNGSYIGFLNVPVTSGTSIDSCLLAIHNISRFSDFNPEDIMIETGAFARRTAAGMGAPQRTREAVAGELFPNGVFARRTAALRLENSTYFNHISLEDFYRQWFTPDRQAIIIVGDIDPEVVQSAIRALFLTIPANPEPLPVAVALLEDDTEPQAVVVYDPEYTCATIRMEMTSASLRGTKHSLTGVALVRDYLSDMLCSLVERRLRARAEAQPFPLISVDAFYGPYMESANRDAFTVEMRIPPESMEDALHFLTSEMVLMRMNGFLEWEYGRTNRQYFKRLKEDMTDPERTCTNGWYASLCLSNWFYGTHMAGRALRHLILSNVNADGTLALTQVNSFCNTALNPDSNMVVTCMIPEDSPERILPGDILDIVNRAKLSSFTLYGRRPAVDSAAFHMVRQSVSPLFSRYDDLSDAQVWEFPNGSKVVFRRVENGTGRISLRAVAKGGWSAMEDVRAGGRFLNDIFRLEKVGPYDSAALADLLADRDITFSSSWDIFSRRVAFTSSKDDFDLAMRLLNLQFTQRERDYAAFRSFAARTRASLERRGNDPENFLSDTLQAVLRGYGPLTSPLHASDVDLIDYGVCSDFISGMMANAADWVFIFTGDADRETVLQTAERYIGSLDGSPSGTLWREKGYDTVNENSSIVVDRSIVAPVTLSDVRYVFPITSSTKDRVCLDILGELISGAVGRDFAELGIDARVNVCAESRNGERAVVEIRFREYVPEEGYESCMPLLSGIRESIAAGDFTRQEFERARERLRQRREEAGESLLLDELEARFIQGMEVPGTYGRELENITFDDAREFAGRLSGAVERSIQVK